MRLGTPGLDFVVIGAQKAGTTSLWRYLDDNPELAMPPHKEASFFSEPSHADFRGYMRALFKDAPRGAKLGTVTPVYMLGTPDAPVPVIAERIHAAAPAVKLIALLRDPVERAYSAWRMVTRRGIETRSFEEAVAQLLAPGELERARREPAEERAYVVAGEYGRMLAAYLERFPRGQLHVELTSDLERAPAEVVRRVCEFVGVEPHEPGRLGERFFASGRERVSAEAEADLKDYLERNVWRRLRHADQHRHEFERWFELWNTVAEPAPEPVEAATAARLRAHYAEDAAVLEAAVGVRAPWAVG
jgi:hypothetical protein